ncbi:MAG: 2,3-cyclic-nucleotide 2-phosphodiesterase / 3-nucleotidase / 5-nucleotidase [Clostridiales bacterium]|nr:2,3-cyclic-nucleotide 2-phosphodiesterase / 3-nucleotidase / 5-nucleotidase [Clostridiales bacterium]
MKRESFSMKKILKNALVVLSSVAMIASSISMPTIVTKAATSDITIQILATSDMHGKFLPYDYAVNAESKGGSVAQIATVVKQLKQENPNTVLIDDGDLIQGNSAELFLKDKVHPMVAAMNLMGYDVFVPGNHEFNYGIPTMQKVLKQQDATVLLGNVYDKEGHSLYEPYTIIERDGVKIGIIGMVTPNITRWDGENLKNYKVTDPVKETKKIVEKLKGKVDVIIAAVHMSESNEYDVADSGSIDLAEACPDIDLIIAAHEHKAVEGVEHNGVLTVENKSDGATVAQVSITLTKNADGTYTVKDKASKLIPTATYEADADMVKALDSYHQKAIKDANQVIGKLKGGNLVDSDEITGIPQSQIAESAMINLINEVQMYYTGAEVSAAAAFNTAANMYEGNIKKCDTALIYKYTNTLYKMQMTGAQLKKFMEWSASYYNTYQDGDLTLSFNPDIRGYNYDMFTGVNYEVNVSKPVGSRIENLKRADGSKIKSTDKIIVAVNNYRASSQLLSYGPIFKEGEALPVVLEKDVAGNIGGVRELIGDYIKNVKGGTITPTLSHNWKVTGTNWDKEKHAQVADLVAAGLLSIPTSEDGRTPNVKAVTENDLKGLVTVSKVQKNLYVEGTTGNTDTMKLSGDATAAKTVSYTSSNDAVVSVAEDGSLTAKKAGKATITSVIEATDGSKQTIETPVVVKKASISFVASTKSLKKGKKSTFRVEVKGFLASDISFATSNDKVLSITKVSKSCAAVIKGAKAGKAKITAKAGTVTKSVTVTVK